MGKFIAICAVLGGIWFFAGDKILDLVTPGRGAVEAYERYTDAITSLEFEEARYWSAGQASRGVENARYIYMASSEPIDHTIRSQHVDGSRVELEAVQTTRYFPSMSSAEGQIRSFVHEVAVEKTADGWKVVEIDSDRLLKDGKRVPADQLGRLKQATGF